MINNPVAALMSVPVVETARDQNGQKPDASRRDAPRSDRSEEKGFSDVFKETDAGREHSDDAGSQSLPPPEHAQPKRDAAETKSLLGDVDQTVGPEAEQTPSDSDLVLLTTTTALADGEFLSHLAILQGENAGQSEKAALDATKTGVGLPTMAPDVGGQAADEKLAPQQLNMADLSRQADQLNQPIVENTGDFTKGLVQAQTLFGQANSAFGLVEAQQQAKTASAPLPVSASENLVEMQAASPLSKSAANESSVALANMQRSADSVTKSTADLFAANNQVLNVQAAASGPVSPRSTANSRRDPHPEATVSADTPAASKAQQAVTVTQTQNSANATMQISETVHPNDAAAEFQFESEMAFELRSDPRVATTGTGIGTSRSDPLFQRPEIPRQVAAQLADIAQRMVGKSVEIALNPEELGRVRLSLTPAENGIAVTVIAERGETLDLMRRNIDVLAQEFRDIGYSDINFSFGQQTEGNGQDFDGETQHGGAENGASDSPVTPDSQQPYQLTLSPADGVDIRV